MANNQTVIATAGLISVGVGTVNSIAKDKKPPSARFLIGSGVAFLILSAMANTDALAEIAKGLALGVMTTVLLGDGGGVLSYLGDREMDTRKKGAGDPKGSDEENVKQESRFLSAQLSSAPTLKNPNFTMATFREDTLAASPIPM